MKLSNNGGGKWGSVVTDSITGVWVQSDGQTATTNSKNFIELGTDKKPPFGGGGVVATHHMEMWQMECPIQAAVVVGVAMVVAASSSSSTGLEQLFPDLSYALWGHNDFNHSEHANPCSERICFRPADH